MLEDMNASALSMSQAILHNNTSSCYGTNEIFVDDCFAKSEERASVGKSRGRSAMSNENTSMHATM